MFSKLVKRNSRRNRKDNGLYFGSLIISIIAFYIILSLSHQDVMIFLTKMESDAVERLLTMIPIFYGITLVILFFLVYFAGSIQMSKRQHEFGIYMSLGMRRNKLLLMLLLEDIYNNIIALGLGLPIAVAFSELISLVTAKIVGLGIIGHHISLSPEAVILTIFGFFLVKFLAFVLLSSRIMGKDLGKLIFAYSDASKKKLPIFVYFVAGIGGVALLSLAYWLGLSHRSWQSVEYMLKTVVLGSIGTVLLFFGLRLLILALIKLGKEKKLRTFNLRQIEELVINKSTALAMCSLLIFAAVSFFAIGSTVSLVKINSEHILDYTFKNNYGDDNSLNIASIKAEFEKSGLADDFSDFVEIKLTYPKKVIRQISEI